jgi:uncharacterized membrane protein
MRDDLSRGVRSTASIGGHPIHPMIIPFPVAFLVGALATDIAFWRTGDAFWSRASMWLVGAGLVMGALAAVFGLIDFATIKRARTGSTGWIHFLGNALALIVALVSLLHRMGDPATAVMPLGIVLSAVTVGILLVTGWLGGELAYRYKIGVVEEADTVVRADPARGYADPAGAFAGDKPDLKRSRPADPPMVE